MIIIQKSILKVYNAIKVFPKLNNEITILKNILILFLEGNFIFVCKFYSKNIIQFYKDLNRIYISLRSSNIFLQLLFLLINYKKINKKLFLF